MLIFFFQSLIMDVCLEPLRKTVGIIIIVVCKTLVVVVVVRGISLYLRRSVSAAPQSLNVRFIFIVSVVPVTSEPCKYTLSDDIILLYIT